MVKKKAMSGSTPCIPLFSVLIIVLVWVSMATWSKVVITVAAALILIRSSSKGCMLNKKK